MPFSFKSQTPLFMYDYFNVPEKTLKHIFSNKCINNKHILIVWEHHNIQRLISYLGYNVPIWPNDNFSSVITIENGKLSYGCENLFENDLEKCLEYSQSNNFNKEQIQSLKNDCKYIK